MSRSSRRVEAARKKVNSAAEDFVHTAADRVGPLAHTAAEKVGPLAEAAADALGAAADKVSPLAHSAAHRVGPLAQQAADRVGPLAQTAADRIAPLAGQAVDRVTPYAREAADRVAPLAQSAAGYAQTAVERGNQVTQQAVKRFGPVLDDAVERVTPAVEAARDRVTADLLPRLSGALSAAAAHPVVEEAGLRAEAALAAAKGELTLPKKKKSRGKVVGRIVAIGAIGAVVVVVARRLFGSQDADWQAARPSAPYVPPPAPPRPPEPAPDPAPAAPADTSADAADTSADAGDDPQAGASVHIETAEANGSPVPDQPAEGGEEEEEEDFAATEPAPDTLLDAPAEPEPAGADEIVVDEVVVTESVADLPETEPVAPTRSPRWSGEGVYVGTEPPEGYVIKGNERSMKYHMPEASGYGRTIAEVWFNSEEAAQQAGFVRAQR